MGGAFSIERGRFMKSKTGKFNIKRTLEKRE